MKTIFTTLLSIAFLTTISQTHLTISQVYGGGGNSGAQYTNDFVEIFNPTSSTVVMTSWSLQYASSAGSFVNTNSVAISGSIAPGKYFLVQLAAGAASPAPLPTPDAIPTTNLSGANGTINMSGTNGKIALVSNSTVLTTGGTGCPSGALVDFVGYGTANCSETTPTPALSNITAAFRKSGGCQDNDNNSDDFTVAAPAPRNSATAANICNFTNPTITANPTSIVLTSSVGVPSNYQSFVISASNLIPASDNITITPTARIEVSLDHITYFPTLSVAYSGGTLANTTIYARLNITAPQGAINDSIILTTQTFASPTTKVFVTGGVIQPYYTKPTGNLDLLSTWGTATNGTGTTPASFTAPYQTFTVNQTTATIGGTWDVSGAGDTIIVGNGIVATTLTVPSGIAITALSKVSISNLGTLVIANNIRPTLSTLYDGSTVNFAETGTTSADTIRIAAISYFNLKLTSGLKYFSGNTTIIRGDLTIDGATGLNGPTVTPFGTINSFGNISIINGAAFEPNPTGDLGRLTLKMNGSISTQTINGPGVTFLLFRLERDSTSASNIAIISGTNITLGNASSGGLLLTPANSVLTMYTNSALNLIGGAVVTPASLGKINANSSTINVLKSAGAANAGILRFISGSTLSKLNIAFDPAFARDSIIIADSVNINPFLTLTKGKVLVTPPAVVTVIAEPVVNGGSAASYFDGKIAYNGSSPFTFPIGRNGKYAPVTISGFSGPNTYTAQYLDSGYNNYTINPATQTTYPAYYVSRKEYWIIDQKSPGSCNLTFTYGSLSGVTNPSAIRITHWGGSNWNDIGGTSSGSNTGGTVTVTAVNTFSPFTLAALSSAPLPIRVNLFSAQKINSSVKIKWNVQQDQNTSYYVIERSADARDWTTLSTTQATGGAGNFDYYTTDNSPAKAMNYYRMKEVDIDGRSQYSDVRAISFSNDAMISINPNPANDYININLVKTNNNPVTIQLCDVSGKMISQQNTTEGLVRLNIQQAIKGIYFIRIIDGDNVQTQKVVLQ